MTVTLSCKFIGKFIGYKKYTIMDFVRARLEATPPHKCDGEDLEGCITDFSWVFAIMVVTFTVTYFLVPSLPITPKPTPQTRMSDTDNMWSIVVYPLLAYLATYHTVACYNKRIEESREHFFGMITPESYWFLVIYSALSFLHLPVVFLKKSGTKSYKVQMLMHHSMTFLTYTTVLREGRLHFYSTAFGMCEICTIFLNNIYLFKMFKAPKPIQAVNGIGLWVSFIVFRIASFPYILSQYYYSLEEHAEERAQVSTFSHYLNMTTGAMLLVLSCWWFISITKGMIKTVRAGMGADPNKIIDSSDPTLKNRPKAE